MLQAADPTPTTTMIYDIYIYILYVLQVAPDKVWSGVLVNPHPPLWDVGWDVCADVATRGYNIVIMHHFGSCNYFVGCNED